MRRQIGGGSQIPATKLNFSMSSHTHVVMVTKVAPKGPFEFALFVFYSNSDYFGISAEVQILRVQRR